MRTLVAAFLAIFLCGCAAVSFPVEFDHISHVTQHFGADQTNYGNDAILAGVRVQPTANFSVTVLDGVTLERGWADGDGSGYGGMLGPREMFQGTVEYDFEPWGRK
ncbi:MAG: hypothetical protein ACRDF8_06635 [Chloroflexota bacterium]